MNQDFIGQLKAERDRLCGMLDAITALLAAYEDEEPAPKRKVKAADHIPGATKKVKGGGMEVKHECCGSKQQKHKKSCEAGVEEEALESAARANTPKLGRKRNAECINCDWHGEIAIDAPDAFCPGCKKKSLVEKV